MNQYIQEYRNKKPLRYYRRTSIIGNGILSASNEMNNINFENFNRERSIIMRMMNFVSYMNE